MHPRQPGLGVATETGWLTAVLTATLIGSGAAAQTEQELEQEDRIAELERTVKVLAEELERTRTEVAVPELPELKSVYGMGPAASKIYGVTRGLSIGGYGEGFYQALVDDTAGGNNRADWLRAVLYTGYKFTENILFNAEFEFEHSTTSSTKSAGGGSVSVEFASLDFLIRDWANARAGLLLVPMGYLNEIHEPPFFFGVNRPEVERRIIPSTWRENGAGLFGNLGEQIEYKAYVLNGFNAEGFDASGLRGGRQSGNRALADHLAFVGRVDWTPFPELQLGGSVYHGKSGQNQNLTVGAMGGGSYAVEIPDADTTIWELHSQFRSGGLHLRALFTMSHLADAGALSRALAPISAVGGGGGIGELSAGESVANDMLGVYAEIAYDVLRWLKPDSDKSFEPFFRFEYLDTQHDVPDGFAADDSNQIQIYTVGLSFKPISNVVIKADYRNRIAEAGSLADEVNLGVGFAF
jgi:hypothetical protein